MADLDQHKRELRARLRRARRSVTPGERAAASAAAVRHLLDLPEVATARTVALYAATAHEADPSAAAGELLRAGTRVAYPRVSGAGLELVAVDEPAAMEPGYRGVLEPGGPALPPHVVDLVVVPGLGFDATGGRLGRGGGHYDRLLDLLPRSALRVGFCYQVQLVAHIPRGARDQPVDVVVTERGAWRAQRDGGDPAA